MSKIAGAVLGRSASGRLLVCRVGRAFYFCPAGLGWLASNDVASFSDGYADAAAALCAGEDYEAFLAACGEGVPA